MDITIKKEKQTKAKKVDQKKNEFRPDSSNFLWNFLETFWQMVTFSIVLFVYLLIKVLKHIVKLVPFMRKAGDYFEKVTLRYCRRLSQLIGMRRKDGIGQVDLIELAIGNMKVRKARTVVTIGGMMVGISAVVFLVSVGFGLQNLVISRVAKLEEIKQADVVLQTGRKIKINDKTIEDFKGIAKVETALPMISAVGKVNFNNSVSDMAVYGVPAEYLNRSAVRPSNGQFFESNELNLGVKEADPSLAQAEDTGNTEVASQLTGKVNQVLISKNAYRQAVVSQAMLKVIGLSESEAVGKTFSTQFVIMGDLLDNPNDKLESEKTTYRIVGVIPETKTPLFYVPFIDLRTLGVSNYSQVKVIAKDAESLEMVRKQVEAMGYNTHSVVDTVNQINSFFATARLMLGLIGMVALSVAGLGMFNTLTVSLLERTREIGLMKSMGMRSFEVRELFLTESMTMGFFGGLLGIIGGYLSGKVLGLLLTIFSVSKGFGVIDISAVPMVFVLIIIGLSVVTGVVTGIYPARRATRISALNALRYE